MSAALTVAWRELRSLFLSPVAWVVLSVYLFLGGAFYVASIQEFARLSQRASSNPGIDPQVLALLNLNQVVVRSHLWVLALLLLFLLPLLTMRLLAEERRMGTAELLLTAPLRTEELVLGKFLGGAGFVGIAVLLSMHYPLFLFALGEPDLLPMCIGYVGLFLAGCCFVAIGLFASSLTDNPVVAAVLGLGLLLGFLFLGLAGENASPDVRDLLIRLSFAAHFQELAKGVFSMSSLLFLGSVIFLALFATLRVVESHRWR